MSAAWVRVGFSRNASSRLLAPNVSRPLPTNKKTTLRWSYFTLEDMNARRRQPYTDEIYKIEPIMYHKTIYGTALFHT